MGRQWRIIQTLISSRRGRSAAELAEEVECHPRTLYRDLETLQVVYTDRVEGGPHTGSGFSIPPCI